MEIRTEWKVRRKGNEIERQKPWKQKGSRAWEKTEWKHRKRKYGI